MPLPNQNIVSQNYSELSENTLRTIFNNFVSNDFNDIIRNQDNSPDISECIRRQEFLNSEPNIRSYYMAISMVQNFLLTLNSAEKFNFLQELAKVDIEKIRIQQSFLDLRKKNTPIVFCCYSLLLAVEQISLLLRINNEIHQKRLEFYSGIQEQFSDNPRKYAEENYLNLNFLSANIRFKEKYRKKNGKTNHVVQMAFCHLLQGKTETSRARLHQGNIGLLKSFFNLTTLSPYYSDGEKEKLLAKSSTSEIFYKEPWFNTSILKAILAANNCDFNVGFKLIDGKRHTVFTCKNLPPLETKFTGIINADISTSTIIQHWLTSNNTNLNIRELILTGVAFFRGFNNYNNSSYFFVCNFIFLLYYQFNTLQDKHVLNKATQNWLMGNSSFAFSQSQLVSNKSELLLKTILMNSFNLKQFEEFKETMPKMPEIFNLTKVQKFDMFIQQLTTLANCY